MVDSDIMECTNCGHTCRRDELGWVQTQFTRYNCEPYDDDPPWYETICPGCWEMESFEELDPGAEADWICDTGEDHD